MLFVSISVHRIFKIVATKTVAFLIFRHVSREPRLYTSIVQLVRVVELCYRRETFQDGLGRRPSNLLKVYLLIICSICIGTFTLCIFVGIHLLRVKTLKINKKKGSLKDMVC
jgi:hypothetical protein